MVEVENNSQQFLAFRRGKKTTQVPNNGDFTTNDIPPTLEKLGIKRSLSRIYPIIREFAPNSKTSASEGRFVQYKLSPDEFTAIINHTIQQHEASTTKDVRLYTIDIANETVIELRGINDKKWEIYQPLLDMLRTTRKQNESGEIEKAPISYQEIKSFFPDNTRDNAITYGAFQTLNKALAPSGWSVIREGKGDEIKKPLDAPWYLRGPDENGDQRNGQPKQETIYERSVSEQRKRIAEKEFDRIDYGTKLLHSCLTHHTNPDAKRFFTRNLKEFMSSNLPTTDLKLQDVIGKISPEEYFEDLIIRAALNMSYKRHQQLSVKQKAIADLWQVLSIESGQHPFYVIFDHFNGHDSNSPTDELNNDSDNSQEDIIKPKRIRGKNKDVTRGSLKFSNQS